MFLPLPLPLLLLLPPPLPPGFAPLFVKWLYVALDEDIEEETRVPRGGFPPGAPLSLPVPLFRLDVRLRSGNRETAGSSAPRQGERRLVRSHDEYGKASATHTVALHRLASLHNA